MNISKGTIVETRDPEDMPTLPDGTVADLIMDNDSVIKRMNVGSLYEVATNAFGAQIHRRLQKLMDERTSEDWWVGAYGELMEFYSIASPFMYEYIADRFTSAERQHRHLMSVIKDGVYLWLPPHSPNIGSEVITQLDKRYGLELHHVRYKSAANKHVITKQKMLIGETYIIMLEKNGFDWSSVASPKRQHFGIIGKMSNTDKHSSPGRESAVRITGEAEIRLLLALVPDYIVADMLDRPNNPAAHKAELRSILEAQNPAQIDLAVDRNEIPLGGNRAIQYIRHIMWCAGVALTTLGNSINKVFK